MYELSLSEITEVVGGYSCEDGHEHPWPFDDDDQDEYFYSPVEYS